MAFLTEAFRSDLLYDCAAVPVIRKQYPDLVVEDARDMMHPDRVKISISGLTNEEFYKFAIREGFANVLFMFHFRVMSDIEFGKAMLNYVRELKEKE